MNTVTLLYVAASVAVMLYTGEELRRIIGKHHLLLVLAGVLVCAGSLGGICDAWRNGTTVYNLLLSLGVAIYCGRRHRRQGLQ